MREDEKDYPNIYNIDHYVVIENLHLHPSCQKFFETAKIDHNSEIESVLNKYVFIVGPSKEGNHWVKEIPNYISAAKKKY